MYTIIPTEKFKEDIEYYQKQIEKVRDYILSNLEGKNDYEKIR